LGERSKSRGWKFNRGNADPKKGEQSQAGKQPTFQSPNWVLGTKLARVRIKRGRKENTAGLNVQVSRGMLRGGEPQGGHRRTNVTGCLVYKPGGGKDNPIGS